MTKQPNTTPWKIYTSTKGIAHLFCKCLNEICMCSQAGWLTQFDSESCQRCLLHRRGGWKQLALGCSSLEGCSWGTSKTPANTPPSEGWAKQGGPCAVQKWLRSRETLCLPRAHGSPPLHLLFSLLLLLHGLQCAGTLCNTWDLSF